MTRSQDEPESAAPRTPGPAVEPATGLAAAGDAAEPGGDRVDAGADRLLAVLRGEGGDGTDPAPPGMDELALRRLMHDAVRGVEPRADALDRLAHAVPARRARRRQAMVGAAAGVLLVGTAMPAVLHATQPTADTTRDVNAVGGPAPGDFPATHTGTGPTGPAVLPTPGVTAPGATPGALAPSTPAPPGAVAAPVPGGGSLTDTPACSRTQLGQGSAALGTPDAVGRVYGTFRVANVSGRSCAVTGPSEISVTVQGSTDPSHIQVVDHTEGDPAGGLPDPDDEPAAVILPPGQAYQVQFAWIPASGGGPSGCAPATSAPPSTGSEDGGIGDRGIGGRGDGGSGTGTGGTGSTGDSAGGTTSAPDASAGGATGHGPAALTLTDDDSGGGDGGGTGPTPPDDDNGSGTASPTPPPPGDGIALSDTPPEGEPAAASTDISGACAGTVYQTDPMPTP